MNRKAISSLGLCSVLFLFFAQGVCLAEKPAKEPKASAKRSEFVLKKMSLRDSVREEGTKELKVALSAKSRCTFGDLDALVLDIQTGQGQRKLQISAEPIGVSGGEVSYAYPAEGKVEKTEDAFQHFTLRLPAVEKPTVMGLFLCTATDGTELRPCAEKKLISFDEITDPYKIEDKEAFAEKGKPSPAHYKNREFKGVEDKIFFFRFMVVTEDSVSFPETAMDDEGYKSLVKYLKEQGADVSDYEALISELKKYGETLGSMPLVSGSEHVKVVLPYRSQKRCGG